MNSSPDSSGLSSADHAQAPTADKPAQFNNNQNSSTTDKSEQSVVDDEYEDAEKNYQPKSLKFWIILTGMYLSVFIVALDR